MPYTLLLADDSVTIQRVIELTFADEDVTVVAVGDGDQAIERLESSPPDIVLADIGMPGKNGYEVAHYIRQSPKLAHIPVVLLTGAFEPVDQARANAAGCDGVLAKPFEPQMVISRVKELLARSRPESGAPVPERPAGPGAGIADQPPHEPTAASADSIWAPRLVTPVGAPATAAAPAGPVPRSELNDYFDRLDVAFSALSSNTQTPSAAADKPPAIETDIDWFGTQTAEGPSAEPWDLPAPPSDTEPADLPLSHASAQAEAWFPANFEAQPLAEVEPSAIAAESGLTAQDQDVAAVPDPELALEPPEEAAPLVSFAPPPPLEVVAAPAPALSAVPTLKLPLPDPPPLPALADAFAALLAAEQGEPPSSTAGLWPASLPPAAAARDELVDEVTRRVRERLSDTVVRDAVADIASSVAERLVREEIERIKASIK